MSNGRPRIEVDERRLVMLRAAGKSWEDIARELSRTGPEISSSTVRNRYMSIEGVTLGSLNRGSMLVSEVRSDVGQRHV